jgi:hypothetical protein
MPRDMVLVNTATAASGLFSSLESPFPSSYTPCGVWRSVSPWVRAGDRRQASEGAGT